MNSTVETTTNLDTDWYEFRVAAPFNTAEAAHAYLDRLCDWFGEQMGHDRWTASCGPTKKEETP